MSLTFKIHGVQVGEKLKTNMRLVHGRMADAARHALNEARQRILTAGRADIARGGNFGSRRWQDGLQGDILPFGARIVNLTLDVYHLVKFWKIFEYGGIIKGRPLLWIPLPWNPTKVRAKEFPGQLFRVNRTGKNPLLMTPKAGGAEAMYVGVKQVRQKRRFHLRTIIRRVAKQMPFLFRKSIRLARR